MTNDSRPLPRMHQRSDHHDYHERGIYLITLCTEGRQPLLGSLVGDSAATATVEPSPIGSEVLRCWHSIPEIQRELGEKKSQRTGQQCTRDISLLAWQLMPDLFHGIIFVRQRMDIALGDVIRGFMVGCTKAYNALLSPQLLSQLSPQICGAPDPAAIMPNAPGSGTPPCQSYPVADSSGRVGRSAYSREGSPLATAPLRPLWQKGYHDRLLTHEGQLQNMIDYVRDNPRRLFIKRLHPSLLTVQHNVRYARWTFSAVGNVTLLDAPLVAVHVRRYFNDEQRRAYMNGCILAARQGATLVSPFISEHEQRVREAAIREGHACIQLCPQAFPELFKPPGELFDPCASG